MPVDFSERCRRMIPYVKVIAEKYDAEVTLLHVVNPFIAVPPTGLSGPAMIPIPQFHVEERRKQLDEFAVAELQDVRARRVLYEGDPVGQIVAFTQSEEVHLIAMPTHGYGVFRRFLIGSDTAKILHDVACPVLTSVHLEGLPIDQNPTFSNILCAIDLGSQSHVTLEYASRLAVDFQAKFSIVHAISPPDPRVLLLASPEFQMEVDRIVRQDIERIQSVAGVEADSVLIEEGEPAKTVCSAAKSLGADLLIIGRGSQDGETGRLRTNAYAIIRLSSCPVISI